MTRRGGWMLVLAACAMGALPVRGDVIYQVMLDTSQLTPGATFDLYFDLTDGSGTGDGNNTVTLSDFSCTSCPSSPVMLTDNMFFQDSTVPITPGPQLTFTLDSTDNLDAGGVPDTFEWQLIDPNAAGGPYTIATTDPITGEDLLVFDITGPGFPVSTYGSADSNYSFDAPTLTASGTPESPTLPLIAAGLMVLGAMRKRGWMAGRR